MNLTAWASLTLVVAAVFPCGARAQSNASVAKLQERAVTVLQAAMREGKAFEKVHAAEALIWSGRPDGVKEYFLDQERAAPEPPYRIGVWRVLYRLHAGNQAAQEAYLAKILAVFSDPAAKDQGTAAETLAKLNYAERTKLVLDLAERGTGDIRVSAQWILANSGREEDQTRLAERLCSDIPKDRYYAAYALRHLEAIRPATLTALQTLAAQEPADGKVRYYVLGTLYTHLPADQRAAVRQELLDYASAGNTDQRYQACMALANWPTADMAPVAEKLLGNSVPDERIGGAFVLLRLGQP